MGDTRRCQSCGADNPAEAGFCIECGTALAQASTGPTVKLNGKVCWSCGTVSPNEAQFCIRCGAGLGGQPAPRQAPPAPRPQPIPPRWAAPQPPQPPRQIRPRPYTPPVPLPTPPQPGQRHPGGNILIALLAVLGIVFFTTSYAVWPAVLLIIAGAALLAERSGRPVFTRNGLLLTLGLLIALSTGFWPIFLLLFFIGRHGRHHRRGPPWQW